MTIETSTARYTTLQRRLVRDILLHFQNSNADVGDTVNQLALAKKFEVSRSPIRAAIAQLAAAGAVKKSGKGWQISDLGVKLDIDEETKPDLETLMWKISRDHQDNKLTEVFSENDLMRRYEVARNDIVAALTKMSEFELVSRRPGFGWKFSEQLSTPEERLESYRYRMIVEPAALLEPSFSAAEAWVNEMIERHKFYLTKNLGQSDAIAFFEMNAEFHESLVSFSNNRYLTHAVRQQNSLRRLRNYVWNLDAERVRQSCEDHLKILALLRDGNTHAASAALLSHIQTTMEVVS